MFVVSKVFMSTQVAIECRRLGRLVSIQSFTFLFLDFKHSNSFLPLSEVF